MKVWITRTQPGAARTAARLSAAGIENLIDPVLRVRPLAATTDLSGFDALAFTSPNAVDAFAVLSAERSHRVYAVGEATAAALSSIGFRLIETADGEIQALARLLGDHRPGRVLHLGPKIPAADLVLLTAPLEVEVVVRPIYETVPLRPETALRTEHLDAVMVHSARAGAIVAEQAGERLRDLIVLALSEACAAPFADGPAKSVRVAPFPDDASLVRLTVDTLSKAH